MKTFAKLFTLVIFALLFVSAFCGCNKTIIDTQYTFDYAYITIGDETIEGSVSSWNDYDDSDMIQVILTNGTVYYTHSTNVILVKKG